MLISNLGAKEGRSTFSRSRLIGKKSNRDGLGALVKLTALAAGPKSNRTTANRVISAQSTLPALFWFGKRDRNSNAWKLPGPAASIRSWKEGLSPNTLLTVSEPAGLITLFYTTGLTSVFRASPQSLAPASSISYSRLAVTSSTTLRLPAPPPHLDPHPVRFAARRQTPAAASSARQIPPAADHFLALPRHRPAQQPDLSPQFRACSRPFPSTAPPPARARPWLR